MARIQKITHIKGNNVTIAGGSVAAIPAAGALVAGEIALNYNTQDPTLIIGTVTNTGTTSSIGTGTTAVAQFKSLKYLEDKILGTSDTTQVKTLKYLTDTLGLLVNDADSVVNTWTEIQSFLSSVPNGETYNLMSLLNNKASGELTVNSTTKLYDNTSITATNSTVNGIPYAQLKVNVGAVTPTTSGSWNTGFTTYTASSYSDNTNTTLRAAKLSDVRDFYDKFNKMFTLDEGNNEIRVNYNLYGVGEIAAYGAGDLGTGSTGGGTSYNRLDLWGDYSVDKTGYVLSAYLGNDLNTRLLNIEGNGATTISTTGAGNAITSVSKTGTAITFTKGNTFLEGNELITLSGDVTGTGNTAITTSIAATTVTSKLLTGYVAGSNTALAATDSILGAFNKIQAQINARPGTVTSIGLTLPTGLSGSTATITSSGTFAVNYASGYAIPTTAKQTNWDTAYTNNHTHANLSTLSGITSTNVTNWNTAYTSVTAATNLNTVSTIVKRDASGNFVAGTISAALSGNSTTATKLQTSRTLSLTGDATGSVGFDGSANASITVTIDIIDGGTW